MGEIGVVEWWSDGVMGFRPQRSNTPTLRLFFFEHSNTPLGSLRYFDAHRITRLGTIRLD